MTIKQRLKNLTHTIGWHDGVEEKKEDDEENCEDLQSKKYFHEVIEEDQKDIGYRIKDVKATQKRKTRDREKKKRNENIFNIKKVDWMKQLMFFGEKV